MRDYERPLADEMGQYCSYARTEGLGGLAALGISESVAACFRLTLENTPMPFREAREDRYWQTEACANDGGGLLAS